MTTSNRSNRSRRVQGALAVVTVGAGFLVAPGMVQAGSVRGVSASPNSVTLGNAVTISVKGAGKCVSRAFRISYGDGKIETYSDVDFQRGNFDVTHRYATAGTKNIAVDGLRGCQGSANTRVQAKPGGGRSTFEAGSTKDVPARSAVPSIFKILTTKEDVPRPAVPPRFKRGSTKDVPAHPAVPPSFKRGSTKDVPARPAIPPSFKRGSTKDVPARPAVPPTKRFPAKPRAMIVTVSPHGQYARFDIKGAAKDLELRLFKQKNAFLVAAGRHCDDTITPFVSTSLTTEAGHKNVLFPWNNDLRPGQTYFYEVCSTVENDPSTSRDDVTLRVFGQFATRVRTVEVSFGNIKVTDDSDATGEGELAFVLKVWWQDTTYEWVEHHADLEDPGTTNPNKKFTHVNPPEEITIEILGGDEDTEKKFAVQGEHRKIPSEFYEDWGLIKQTVDTKPGSVGEPLTDEETKVYQWTATNHGLGFKAYVKVSIKDTPNPKPYGY